MGCATEKPSVIKPPFINFSKAECRPAYPIAALREEQTGTVRLSVLVEIDGTISEVKILSSSGFPLLDNAVRDRMLAKICKGEPGAVDGQPQKATIKVQYVWKLN